MDEILVMKALKIFAVICAIGLTACGTTVDNDPIYRSLLANPPVSIPAVDLAKLRKGLWSCNVFKEGQPDQYMTCWFPSGLPPSLGHFAYFGPGLVRPDPSRL